MNYDGRNGEPIEEVLVIYFLIPILKNTSKLTTKIKEEYDYFSFASKQVFVYDKVSSKVNEAIISLILVVEMPKFSKRTLRPLFTKRLRSKISPEVIIEVNF